MKISRLIKILQEQNNPDEEICVLWWEKNHFDRDKEETIHLTEDGWAKVVAEFERWDEAGDEVGEWIAESVNAYLETK